LASSTVMRHSLEITTYAYKDTYRISTGVRTWIMRSLGSLLCCSTIFLLPWADSGGFFWNAPHGPRALADRPIWGFG
jgi:hypothetical protein